MKNLIRWAKITASSSDNQQFAVQQLTYLNKVSDSILVFPYGIHANVTPDALALMFSIQNNPENRAAIAWTPKKRPKLNPSEVAFYHPPTDAFIIWRKNGDLDIETGNKGKCNINIKASDINIDAKNINIDAKNINIKTNKMNIKGDTFFTGKVFANQKDIGENHRHHQSPDSDGNSEADINGVI